MVGARRGHADSRVARRHAPRLRAHRASCEQPGAADQPRARHADRDVRDRHVVHRRPDATRPDGSPRADAGRHARCCWRRSGARPPRCSSTPRPRRTTTSRSPDSSPARPTPSSAQSNGVAALPSVALRRSPFGTSALRRRRQPPIVFTTPQPPPGKYLFSIALCNDLHLGETTAGLVTTQRASGCRPASNRCRASRRIPRSWRRRSARETRERGARRVARRRRRVQRGRAQVDMHSAKAFLDGFGDLRDRLLRGPRQPRPAARPAAAAACQPVAAATAATTTASPTRSSQPGDPRGSRPRSVGLRILGLDTYDTIGNGAVNGVMSARADRRSCARAGHGPRPADDRVRPPPRAARRRRSPRAAGHLRPRPAPRPASSRRCTRRRPACSCITPATPTATSGRSRRSAPQRDVPGGGRGQGVPRRVPPAARSTAAATR